jgi:hypothetical protein
MRNPTWPASIVAAALHIGAGLTTAAEPAAADAASPAEAPLTNLAHLDFLLDQAAPQESDTHTTYRLAEEPELTFPWTYAEPRADGSFERIGGGPLDAETGHYSQGAYNSDDISRAAVVYLRHWQQTGTASSRDTAYELLRGLAYMQTVSGPNSGNVVLWIQADGELNPSAEPVELPDPSDSGPSYWLARTIWAFGEGYAAFRDEDPEFAGFLRDRLGLAVEAVDRQVLSSYGEYTSADGMTVPSWLIADGADASAEAVLGLAAYVEAAPDDDAARDALAKLSEGIAAMGAGDARTWPYGAILPWAQSRSMWHGWGSQMPAGLAAAAAALDDHDLLGPAITDSAVFTPTVLTAGGPDNGWFPAPTERNQIAYGVDSRLQSLLAVADVADRPGFDELAALMASWYFGTNASGSAMYDPATGRTFDGVAADGVVNGNSGAESTIHGLLSMLALDARPDVRERALALTSTASRDGLSLVEAEDAAETEGSVVTPDSAWTGESVWSGDYLELAPRQYARFDLGASAGPRLIEPVSWLEEAGPAARSRWTAGRHVLANLKHVVGDQGISAVPGALLPLPLAKAVPAGVEAVSATALGGPVRIDALLVRPEVSRVVLTGEGVRSELVHSAATGARSVSVGESGASATARVYDVSGRLVSESAVSGVVDITLPPGGFAVVTG